ncbi:prolipoprotein diacylglyceryl transferase [Sphingobacterium sp. SRCM116780]|uniref:prolipoprotein diacylglyceryl transferase n=1 Tax=Sphingobacterium sp. SRCM116780 TaxID=2907623 RepID=UPI001F472E4F|nr:prolipoprotein diacylglyceryl transferase [Sphingobacterium sp. SRCM116780]UIR57294.1 prolipoprotein diacylglyceryl transferase [Sphingobacterium sp. SRCM116780]
MIILSFLLNFISWNVDSDIFVLPIINHPIRWYGLFWLLGILLCYRFLDSILKKESKPIEFLDQLTIYIVVGTMLGARLGHVLFYDPSYYLNNPLKIFAVWEGGLASHGGGIGILVAIYLFARKNKLPFLWVADRIALVVPIAGASIRLGNLMNSEMIGKQTDMPWAFVFTRVDQIPRHPAQLYEAIFCIFLFVLLYYCWKKPVFRNQIGNCFALLLILLFSFRFMDEFLKINQEHFEDGMLINMGQILSIPFILIGLILFVINYWKSKTMGK